MDATCRILTEDSTSVPFWKLAPTMRIRAVTTRQTSTKMSISIVPLSRMVSDEHAYYEDRHENYYTEQNCFHNITSFRECKK